ncbi:MAG: hypothetical protein ACRET6_07625 [Burkholderiales bacterium]
MRRLHWVALLVALSFAGVGETGANRRMEAARPDQASACLASVTIGAAGETVAQQACCKANKGVCGCRAGKIVCCDKTFSDTCTCNRDEAPDGVH